MPPCGTPDPQACLARVGFVVPDLREDLQRFAGASAPLNMAQLNVWCPLQDNIVRIGTRIRQTRDFKSSVLPVPNFRRLLKVVSVSMC